MADSFDIMIIGGGPAGIALAAELAHPRRRVAVLEQQEGAPLYEGASVGLRDPIVEHGSDVLSLLLASTDLYGMMAQPMRPRGVLHIFSVDNLAAYGSAVAHCRIMGVEVEELAGDALIEMFPFLRDNRQTNYAALYAAAGIADKVDVSAFYARYRARLRQAHGAVLYGERLVSARREAQGWTVVTSSRRTIRCGILANCAGAWADDVAIRCGIPAAGIRPMNRTVLEARLMEHDLNPAGEGMSVRWAGPRGLVCEFDAGHRATFSSGDTGATGLEAGRAFEATPDRNAIGEALNQFHARTHLRYAGGGGRVWAVTRGFTADNRPVIGWGPREHGFFWSAGFGGYGIACAPAAACLAADLILGDRRYQGLMDSYGVRAPCFDPGRFNRIGA